MKKTIAIFCMLLLAFNWYGYQLLVDYYSAKAGTELQSKLDRSEFDESKLVEVRVPLNMPYVGDWQDFETYEGKTEINGIHYRYVKRKVENGELVLLCMPDRKTTTLKTAGLEMFKWVSDMQTGAKKESKPNQAKPPLTDLLPEQEEYLEVATAEAHKHNCYNTSIPSDILLSVYGQPPEC